MPYRIFIADDHHLVVDGIRAMVAQEEDMCIAGTASDGKEALDRLQRIQVDLLLLDLDMPEMSGIEVARQLIKQQHPAKIAIMSMHAEPSVVARMQQMGAVGYIVKSADKDEFLFGLRRMLKGKTYFHPDAISSAYGKSSEIRSNPALEEQLSSLSNREKEVLALIARGMTSAQIAKSLFLSTRTVETHRKHIHTKLEIPTLAGIIRFAIQSGLVE